MRDTVLLPVRCSIIRTSHPLLLSLESLVWLFVLVLRSTVPHLANIIYRYGFKYTICYKPSVWYGSGAIGLWTQAFVFSKVWKMTLRGDIGRRQPVKTSSFCSFVFRFVKRGAQGVHAVKVTGGRTRGGKLCACVIFCFVLNMRSLCCALCCAVLSRANDEVNVMNHLMSGPLHRRTEHESNPAVPVAQPQERLSLSLSVLFQF